MNPKWHERILLRLGERGGDLQPLSRKEVKNPKKLVVKSRTQKIFMLHLV
jgi:hypothetical protein